MTEASLLRLLEAEAQDALDPGTGEDRGLDRDLVRRALVHAPAGAGILALGVLADAEDIEVLRAQRALDARQQAMRADVGILHERLADRQQQAVQRDGIGHLRRPADGAEQDGVETAQGLDAVFGYHTADLLVEGAGPREFCHLQRETQLAGHGF